MSATRVTRHLLATVVSEPTAPQVHVSLTWRANDPFALRMDVHTYTTSVRWVLALDLLVEGVESPAGAWDVRVRPVEAGRTEIVLTSPSGTGVFLFSTYEVVAFLAETWCALPAPVPDYIPADFEKAS